MKHLIIFAHPNTDSLNATLKQTLADHLQAQQHDVVVRDLYQLNFNPVLSLQDMQGQRAGQVASKVKREQEFITWAECITFIYPIWWTGLPAIMKGYIDRVFSYGFAYRYDQGVQQGLLVGKQVVVINTHGKSTAEYEESGMDKALSLASDMGIYEYCGLRVKRHFYFDQADRADAATIDTWRTKIKSEYAA
ncbi:NAD(P)H-dependent oxidoreductase [Leucothrix mucor]|uniref:NAD(P)H-dependent oxidoreductase n=1 Tax=Leucothrix mucor TaxID=45248 RepID=UPI0003B59E74|nr:NAD(P)H-dependent oxidoreductase [Leucothrix mucor]